MQTYCIRVLQETGNLLRQANTGPNGPFFQGKIMNDKEKCCKGCSFFSKFHASQKNTGWCEKRERVVGRKTNFFTNAAKDFCNFFFIRKNHEVE